jgi:hypothetical protein
MTTAVTQPTRGNLLVELTSFVGRRPELNEVRRLLSSACVITLTGPGRTGTSPLALLEPGGTSATFRMACRRNDVATSLEGLAWVAGSSGRRERAAPWPGADAALFEELGLHANVS